MVVSAWPVLEGPKAAELKVGGRCTVTGGSSTALGGEAYDDELVVTHDRVCWIAGGVLRKQYSTSSPVLQAGWCYFQNTGPDKILCLLQDAALTVYTQDGDSHIIPLPGRFTAMWPLPQGVLLTGAEGQGPCILVHPLENIQHVSVAADGSGGGGSWGEGESVVWSSLDVPYLVTYNQHQRRVAVWSVGTQPAQGFVSVTPMQWPGTPRTPATQGGGGHLHHTPLSRGGVPGSATGGYKKPSLRLPNGSLSPLAFQPVPRPVTPIVQPAAGGGDQPLLLPSQEVPVHFSLLWEQRVPPGGGQPEEGHLVTDENGGLLLCLLSRATQRVTALRLPTSAALRNVEVAFALPALSIAAVTATHRAGSGAQPPAAGGTAPPLGSHLAPRDLLVLHPDGRLALMVGAHQVCTLALPTPGAAGTGGSCGGAGSPLSSAAPAASPYAGLLGLRAGGSPQGAAGTAARVHRLDSSQLSAMRRHSSAGGEVQFEGMALGSDGYQDDSDEEMGQASPSPPPTAAPTPRDTMPDVRSLADALREPLEPVALKDAAANRVTVVGRDGCSVRICLPFAPASQLVTSALDALRAALPLAVCWRLYGEWLASNGSCSGDGSREWAALSSVVLRWAQDPATLEQQAMPHFSTGTTSSGPSASTGLLSPTSGSTPLSLHPSDRAWEQLLASTTHKALLARRRFVWASGMVAPDAGAAPAVQQGGAQQGSREPVWRALQALHSVYEDMKMSVLSWHLLLPLGTLLAELAGAVGAACYQDHYGRDLGIQVDAAAHAAAPAGASGQQSAYACEPAPDLFKCLHSLLRGVREMGGGVPALAQQRAPVVQRSSDLLACYGILAEVAAACGTQDADPSPDQLWALLEGGAQRVVLELVKRRWTLAQLDSLPFGVALPLRQALHQCRSNPPGDWPREAYVLIGRNDIAAGMAASQQHDKPEALGSAIVSTPLGKMAKVPSPTKKPTQRHRLATPSGPLGPAGVTPAQTRVGVASLATPPAAVAGRVQGGGGGGGELLWPPEGSSSRLPAQPELGPLPYTQRVSITGAVSYNGQVAAGSGEGLDAAPDPSVGDGMDDLGQQSARLRFGRDLRLLEVRNLLRSSAPVVLKLGPTPEATDEGSAVQQIKLTTLAVRTMALPVGRGALTLGTFHPLPTEPLQIPALCMAGRSPEQNNAVVNLDLSAAPPAPGGGAFCDHTAWPEFHNGAAAGLRLAPSGQQLTRTWIVYNKPEEPSYTHAGLLMALGLTGHLSCLAATDLYRYLSQEHDATIIGVLLGMAAAKRGSLDSSISRMLFLHLPTRHPSSYPELEISSLVQAAALLGVGLLFQGSCHRLMAEVMLEEIGRRPGSASKQAESSAAGVNLHQGVSQDREGYALAAGMALGVITLGRGRAALGLADLHLEERLRYFMLGGSDSGTVASQRGLAAVVGQGNSTTEGVFGPGIIGFDPTLGEPQPRFANPARDSSSGRASGSVAEELAAAQGSSQVVLEGELVNLDVTSPAATVALGLMYLKTNDRGIAKLFALPETHFALDFVRPEHLQLRVLMRSLVMWGSVAPTEEWVQAQLPPIMQGPLSKLMRGNEDLDGGPAPIDTEAVAQAHCQVVAGACLAIGIRYAGSCSAPAQALLRKNLMYFINAKQGVPEPGAGAPGPVTRDVLEGCVGVVALALAVVMAGSGHLDTLKLLRGLRKRIAAANVANATQPTLANPPTTSYTYGGHLAVGMALGFLFMGAGALTFATTPQAVAALVISLFPRLPASTTDNRCHLQAFRHLYVLATQPRSVDAMDVDTHAPVYVPLDISLAPPKGAPAGAAPAVPPSGLRPVVSISKGAGDVLAQYAAGSEGGSSVSFERVAPCLLPEREQVSAVAVKGPRYWPQLLLSGGRGGGLDALYKTQTLFVQRKAGALPYANDPSGVRSLLSRMFHWGGSGEGGFDLVDLCATFGSDPFITSFAQVFCSEAVTPLGPLGSFASQLPVAAASLLDFCRGALYECIAREKAAALLPYLTLWCMAKGLSSPAAALPDLAAGLAPAVPLWSLKMCLAYCTGNLGLAARTLLEAAREGMPGGAEAAAEQWEPLVSPLYLQSCWQQLQRAWEAAGVVTPPPPTGAETGSGSGGGASGSGASSSSLLSRYLRGQQVEGSSLLGAYLQLCEVPAVAQVREVLERVERTLREMQLGAGPSARSAAAALLAAAFKGMPVETVQAMVAAAAVTH